MACCNQWPSFLKNEHASEPTTPNVSTLSPTLFLIYINGLLCVIEKCLELSVKFSENTLSTLLFADDCVGVAEA